MCPVQEQTHRNISTHTIIGMLNAPCLTRAVSSPDTSIIAISSVIRAVNAALAAGTSARHRKREAIFSIQLFCEEKREKRQIPRALYYPGDFLKPR